MSFSLSIGGRLLGDRVVRASPASAPARYAVMLFVLQLAFGVFGPNPISELLTAIIAFLPALIVAIIITVIASAVAAAVKTLIEGSLGGLSYGKTLANIAAVFILGLGIIAALNPVGIATTVTTPVLVAVLATIGGILVVGVGGGLVRPCSPVGSPTSPPPRRWPPRSRPMSRTLPA
ncbi:MAG: hypothetical protein ABIU87_01665 [Ornithinibacter sp.]